MNTTQQQNGIKNEASVKSQLKTIGDQIETIAKLLESQGSKLDSKGLNELGNKVEHFFDNMESKKPVVLVAKPAVVPAEKTTGTPDWKANMTNMKSDEKPTPASFSAFDKKASESKNQLGH